MTAYPRVLPVGDRSLSVELGDGIDPATNARVHALDRSLAEDPLPGVLECVPTYRSLLVVLRPEGGDAAELAPALRERARAALPAAREGRRHEVPTVYGGEDGPDLEPSARACGLGAGELVRLHSSAEYTAFMVGFLPGFAYLGLLPERLALPRLPTPRPRVPAGSVGIAGRQTGVYPACSPGGWRLIGRTSLALFDASRDPPALIAPGDTVRFVPVRALDPIAPPAPVLPAGPAGVEVLDGGLLTTVQDVGRTGLRRHGVGQAGAMDPRAARAANLAVNNEPGAALLECTLAGPVLRFLAPLRFALAGADLGAVLDRADLGAWPVPLGRSVLARPGNVLRFAGRVSGARAYLAFAGGLDVPVVLGSRSTDLAGRFGGLGGRALRAGDGLRMLAVPRATGAGEDAAAVATPEAVTVRVVPGPQDDHFAPEALAAFHASEYRVSATSDRIGLRLEGEPLARAGPGEIATDGMVPGCVQVPPDGRPIVMTADGPTTGGYPKIATVVRADLPLLAQLVPGEGRVRFRRT